MLRGLFVVLLGAGCGRLSFSGSGQGEVDAAEDAGGGPADAYVGCGLRATPDPLTVSGQTFRYTSFDNDRNAMPGVAASLLDRATGTIIDDDTSMGDGSYSLQVTTGGLPADVMLQFEADAFFTTRFVPDVELDADVAGANAPLWSPGDAPLWNANAMGMVYDVVGATLDPARSTVNIAVRDCAGNAVEDVAVIADPAPGTLVYQGADGRPSATASGTVAPFAHALLLNAVPGPTRITGTKAGVTFVELTLDVPAGDFNTLTILRVVE